MMVYIHRWIAVKHRCRASRETTLCILLPRIKVPLKIRLLVPRTRSWTVPCRGSSICTWDGARRSEQSCTLYRVILVEVFSNTGEKWRCKNDCSSSRMFNRRNARGVLFSRTIGSLEWRVSLTFELNSLIYQEDNSGSQHGDTLSVFTWNKEELYIA